MAFDECTPWPADEAYVKQSLERTTRWLDRCIKAHKNTDHQALFGIIQGGTYAQYRQQSAGRSRLMTYHGYALADFQSENRPICFTRCSRKRFP